MTTECRQLTETASQPEEPAVFVVAPGGVRDPAGIGRLVTTVIQFWRATGGEPRLRIVDPYGPAKLAIAPVYFVRAIAQIVWNAWRGRVALLHIHMARGGSLVRKGIVAHLGARLGVPVILHLHAPDLDESYRALPALAQRWLRRTLHRADRVVVLGEYWRRVVVNEIGVHPTRVVVLANAVAGPARLPERTGGGPCRILFLGRLEAEKGVPELLDALADEQLAGLPWCARLAGRGEVREYRQRAAALGLAGRVEIHDWVPEPVVRQWLAEADVFVQPSHHEGLSMALLEAMAFGLAVITTPVGATADAVVDGVSGLLVPVGDRRALAAALERVIADRRFRAALQNAARQRFQERFDIAGHCRRLRGLYAEVCPTLKGVLAEKTADSSHRIC